MRVGVVYSGGKDSTRAVYEAKRVGEDIRCLITMIPESEESYMFHYPNAKWTTLQAEAMGIPIVVRETGGIKEAELTHLSHAIEKAMDMYDLEGIYTGGVSSRYQKERFERVSSALSLRCVNPLWGMSGVSLLQDLLRLRFEVIFVGVSAAGFDQSWLGRRIDSNAIEELKALHSRFQLNLAFEGGEAETFVLDCPLFQQKLKIVEAEKQWKGDRGFLLLRKASLADKKSVKDALS